VSGFLSENDIGDNSWQGVLLQDESKVYYDLKWKAGQGVSVFKKFAKKAAGKGVELGLMLMLGHAIGIIGGIAMTSEFYKDFSSVFKESK
jgi:hypothetical protein